MSRSSSALFFLGLATLPTCILSPGCQFGPARHRETRTLERPHQEGGSLAVHTVNGAIRVRRDQAEAVTIRARIAALTRERLEGVEVLAERDPGGLLTIEARWPAPGRRNNEGCSFEVTLPGAKGVVLETRNGAIHLEGLEGRARLATSNGGVRVPSHRGSLEIETSNGSVQARVPAGPVRVRTSNGSVTVAAGTGPVEVETSNGGVRLTAGPAFAGELALSTSNGRIDLPDRELVEVLRKSRNRVRLRLGRGNGESRIATTNGSILVRRGG